MKRLFLPTLLLTGGVGLLTKLMNAPPKSLKSSRLLVLLGLLVSTSAIPAPIEIPATNALPTNVFLTDEGKLFWYKGGERLVETKKIEEALNSKESRPASQDPEGHWGQVLDGFQLSLRFEKQDFTNGEAITATVLIRNVSENTLSYVVNTMTSQPAPINVAVCEGHERLKLITENTLIKGTARTAHLYAQTQHKYQVRLDKYYDLGKKGIYSVQAEYSFQSPGTASPGLKQNLLASQQVTISVR
jgi:hypothetical protein